MGIRIDSADLTRELAARAKGTRALIDKGGRAGLLRGQALLVRKSPSYMGQLRASWKVRGTARTGYQLVGDAPHAGIVELGARPHPVSRAGREAIKAWVMKVILGMTPRRRSGPLTPTQASGDLGAIDARAEAITWGIVAKLKKEGQKGTFIVRDSLDNIRGFIQTEVETLIKRDAGKPSRRGK